MAEPRATGPFAYSYRDALLCALVALHLAGLVVLALTWRQLDRRWLPVLGILHAYLVCHHFQCTIHYVMHTPFFRVRWLNRAIQLVGSAVVMSSATSFFTYHLLHHRHGNDPIDGVTGKPRDPTSTFARGKHGRYGGLLETAVLPVLRQRRDALLLRPLTRGVDGAVKGTGARRRARADQVVVASLLGVLVAIDPVFAALFVAASSLGHVYGNVQNYLEHYGAIPGSRSTDAVSCYSRYYNLVWFNNGYHQEHHHRAGAHWTQLPALRDELPAHRRTVRVNYFLNLPVVSAAPLFEGTRQDLERRQPAQVAAREHMAPAQEPRHSLPGAARNQHVSRAG